MKIISITKHILTDIDRKKFRRSSVCLIHITTEDNYYFLKITDKQRKLLVKNLNLVIRGRTDSSILYNQKEKQ